MRCEKCGLDFEEKDLQESHDVPVYMFKGDTRNVRKNQADKHGRHWLCRKCHDIYEKLVFAWMISPLPDNLKEAMIKSAETMAKFYFPKRGHENDGI